MKKRFYLLLILSMLFVSGCKDNNGNDPTPDNPPVENGGNENGGNENGGNENGGNENGGNENGSTDNETITVLKDTDSFELDVLETVEVDLTQYFSYSGTKYSYSVSTENKEVVDLELLGNKLTLTGNASGVEKIKVTLNDKEVEFTVTVSKLNLEPTFDDYNVTYDLNGESNVLVTLIPKEANGYSEFVYTLKEENSNITIDGDNVIIAIDEVCEKTIVLLCQYEEGKTVEVNINVKVVDSTYDINKVLNGSFDNGLEGWLLNGEIGCVTEESVFWSQQFPIYNEGKYFSGGVNGLEQNVGTLTSSSFILGGNGYITFMLGAAGNENCYITILDAEDNILAIYRNTKFKDLTPEQSSLSIEEQQALIGSEVNTLNLIKYKADLSAHIGKEIKVVINDNATSGFGFVTFDELVTYNTEIPGDDYSLAVNQLADLTAVNELINEEINEQGDYTESSYNAYKEAVLNAKLAIANPVITQTAVDSLVSAIIEAYNGLQEREITVKNAVVELTTISNKVLLINYYDYFDTNELSSITFEYSSEQELILEENIVKFDTNGLELGEYKITLKVLYKGEVKHSVELTVNVLAKPEVQVKEEIIEQQVDLYYTGLTYDIDLSANVVVVGGLELTYKVNDEVKTDNIYTHSLTLGENIINVLVVYEYEGINEVAYTIKLNVYDTTGNRVLNGSFDNDLEGWTLDGEIGGVSDAQTFWGEGLPMNNVGKYFSGYAKDGLEVNTGTLTSSTFVLGGTGYITFMLGGAGNENCYITVLDKDNNLLAIYRNTEFKDFPAGFVLGENVEEGKAMIGDTVNLANLIKYKADLSSYIGEEIKIVVNDYALGGWGLVFFDEVSTYYTEIPCEEYNLALNQLADLTEINELLAQEIKEQGDYTDASYNAYKSIVERAKEQIADKLVKQNVVDLLVNEIKTAYNELVLREIIVKDTNNNVSVIINEILTIDYNDYFDSNSLSSVTYDYESTLELEVIEGKLNFKAIELGEYTVTLKALYKDEVSKNVVVTIKVTNDPTPIIINEELVVNIDIYENGNKYIYDLANNVNNAANLDLMYYVNDEKLENSSYSCELEDTCELTVKVVYTINEVEKFVSYSIKLNVTDTTKYRLSNGGFENGLDDWLLVGNVGNISSDTHYWVNDPESPLGFEFGMDGEKMFSAYALGAEERAVGTLTSSKFIVGGSGYVTYKIGAMRDGNYVYVDVVDANTKEILARYYNGLWAEKTNDVKSGCTLISYKANLSQYIGKEVFFRISDNADSGYGLFFADSFITYYPSEPEGFNEATSVDYQVSGTIYDVFNGGFEMGGNQGWWNVGEPGAVTSANAFFSGVAYGKEGNFLYSGVEDHGAGNGREGNRGVLTSSVFEIGGTGYISFMLGGGGNSLCYVQVVDAVTGEIFARYHQQQMEDAVLKQYVADLSAYIGRTARIQVVDQAVNNWGCVSFDNVVTYYPEGTTLPSGIAANDIKSTLKYTIDNGSFETGNIDGWNMHITEAGAHNTLGWVLNREIEAGWYSKNDDVKDGEYLLTFATPEDVNCENTKGTLQSSTFSLKQGSYVSFKFGGAGGYQNHDVYIELCREDGSVIARFYNDAPGKVNTRMNCYYYQYNGVEVNCFFRIVDNSTGDYGCFVVDDFRVNLEVAPEGYIQAIQ